LVYVSTHNINQRKNPANPNILKQIHTYECALSYIIQIKIIVSDPQMKDLFTFNQFITMLPSKQLDSAQECCNYCETASQNITPRWPHVIWYFVNLQHCIMQSRQSFLNKVMFSM